MKIRGGIGGNTNFVDSFSPMASGLVSSQLMYWVNHWFILSSRSLVHALAGTLRKIRMAEAILVIPFKSLDIRVSLPRGTSHTLKTHRTPVCDPLVPPTPRFP